MKISKHGLDFIKSFESFVPFLYDDLRYNRNLKYGYAEYNGTIPLKGTLTIGYGHTKDALAKVNMDLGTRVTEAEASRILDEDLDEIEDWINKNVKVKLTQGQFDALVSFGFNCGTGNLAKLVKPLNSGDYRATRAKFDEFVRSKGIVLAGLQRRRDGEQEMWDATYQPESERPSVRLPEAPVDHPAEVDTPKVPVSTEEKLAGGVSTLVPLITALTDWKVAVVVGVVALAGLGFYMWNRRR